MFHSCNSMPPSPLMNYSVQDTGSSGGGGWLEKLAEALGKAAGELANKLNSLAEQISQQNGANAGDTSGTTGGTTGSTTGTTGSNPSGLSDATQSITSNAQLQGLAQEFQQLMSAIENVIKTIGEAEASMARK